MAGVNVKMGVSGVAEFKRSMKESQTAVKTLDQELKKSEAQYKATGDKEKYMADQSKLLKQKLEEQKRTAKEAEKALDTMRKQGVEQTSTAYQEMSRQLAKAQTDIYNTQAAMNGLSASETQAAQSANTLGKNISGIAKGVSLQNISSGLQNISGMLERAANYALQIGKNIVSSVKDAAQYADDTATLAQVYEIPLERLLQMQALVDAGLDTSVDAMVSAMSKMKRGVGKESTEAMNYLKQFGLVATVAGGKTGDTFEQLLINDPDELFWKAGQGIMAMADAYEKETAAQAIFGRSWRELIPLFTAYKDQESFSKALENTNINSADTIESMAELNDKFGELEHNFEVVKVELLNALSPALTQVSDIISGVLKEFNDYLSTEEGQQKMKELTDAVTDLFSGLKDVKPGDVIDTAKDILTGIVDALKWISNNWQTVVTGIEAICGVWAVSKITSFVTEAWKAVDAMRQLGGGGNDPTTTTTTTTTHGTTPVVAPQTDGTINFDSGIGIGLGVGWVLKEQERLMNRTQVLYADPNDPTKTSPFAMDGYVQMEYEEWTKKVEELSKESPAETQTELVVEDPAKQKEDLESAVGVINVPANIVPATYWWGRRPVGGGSPLTNYMQDVEGREYGHANGLPFVPYEGYYHLHQGERVLTAGANRNYTYNSNTYFGSVNLNNGLEIDALSESIARQNRRHNAGYGT